MNPDTRDPEPISRPSVLTSGDISRLVKAMEKHGGNVTIQDPRVSQVQAWIFGIVGASIVGMGIWMINSINTLNKTMERVVTTNEYTVQRIYDHDRRLEILEAERRK